MYKRLILSLLAAFLKTENKYIGEVYSMATKSRYLWAIETALKENNISTPYPQRDIHFYEGKNEKI